GNDQVLLAIAVQVSGCHTLRTVVGGVKRSALKRTIAIAEQNGNGFGAMVLSYVAGVAYADHQVHMAIAIEIGDDQGGWRCCRDVVLGRPECAVALTQQHRNAVFKKVGYGHIEFAIAVEVACRHVKWTIAYGETHRSAKCRGAGGEPDGYGGSLIVGCD